MIGPKSESRGVAFFEWNALPRPLRWTKEPPTEPGLYWYRNKKSVKLNSSKERWGVVIIATPSN